MKSYLLNFKGTLTIDIQGFCITQFEYGEHISDLTLLKLYVYVLYLCICMSVCARPARVCHLSLPSFSNVRARVAQMAARIPQMPTICLYVCIRSDSGHLGNSCGHLGNSCGLLGNSCGHLDNSCRHLDNSCGHLSNSLGSEISELFVCLLSSYGWDG